MQWITVCTVTDIEPEEILRFDHCTRTFAIIRSPDGEFFCTDGLCTHEEVHLSEGMVFDYEIECPKHSGVFDYRNGEALRPPVCINLNTYPTRIEADLVQIGLDE